MANPNASKKFFLYKALALLFFLFFANKTGVESCAYYYEWPDMDDTLSFIEPSVVRETIFNEEYLFYSPSYGIAPHDQTDDPYWYDYVKGDHKEEDLEAANLDEWTDYLKAHGMKKVNRDGLKHFIYSGTDMMPYNINGITREQRQQEVETGKQMATDLMKGGTPNPKNHFAAFAGQKDLVEYVNFINGSNESLHKVLYRPGHYDRKVGRWVQDEVDPEKDLSPQLKVAEQRAYSKDYDDFFRVKYAFQAMQMYAALDKHDADIERLYDTVVGPSKTRGLTRYRCEGYKAFALCDSGKKNQAFSLYVDMFDQCPALRFTATQSVHFEFKPEDAEELAGSMTNGHRKTAAYFLAGVSQRRGYSTKLIEGMLGHGVNEAETQAMMVRMVEVAEIANMKTDRLALMGVVGKAGTQYDDLVALCQGTGENPQAGQPALWLGIGSYLSLLEGNTDQAETLLDKAKAIPTKNKSLTHQLHVWGTLLALAKDQKSVSPDTQKALMEDLDWAKGLKEWGNNKGLYHSLLVLAGGKYLSLMDLPHSILCFEAAQGLYNVTGPTFYGHSTEEHRNGIYNMSYQTANYLIDAIATDEELVKLGTILEGQREAPIDGWLKAKSEFTAQDLLLVRAVKKMRVGDYHGAQALLDELPASYLKKPAIPSKNKYGEIPPVYYPQSKCLSYKQFQRCDQIQCLNPKAKVVYMDIRAYCKWMGDLTNKIAAARQNKSPQLSKLLFRLANAYASSWATGWPEVKMDHQSGPIHTYYPETKDKFPLGIPTVSKEMKARFQHFQDSTPNYYRQAAELFTDIVTLGKNRELVAKSLVAQNWLIMQLAPPYATTYDSRVFENLKLLRKKYASTDFYKDFEPRCGWLTALDTKDFLDSLKR